MNKEDEKIIFDLLSSLSDNLKINYDDGIKNLLNWLTLLVKINEKENFIKYQNIFPSFSSFREDVRKPKELLNSLYEK